MIDKRRTAVALSGLTVLMFSLLAPSHLAFAQESNRVAVVVRYADDETQSRCVSFEEEQISGYDALRGSGFSIDVGFNVQGGKVCSIDGTGCAADDCFCRCKGGGDCIYWSYWHRSDESWEYARVGAAAYKVQDGGVEGWSWGPGSISQATEPPAITFDQVCNSIESGSQTSGSHLDSAPEVEEGGILSAQWLQVVLLGSIFGIFALALVFSQIRRNRR